MELDALEQDCIQAFQHADEDGKGFLTPSDYKVAVLELCGYKPSKYEINAVWSKLQQAPPPTTQCSPVSPEAAAEDIKTSSHSAGMNQATFRSLMVERLRRKDKDELIRQIFVAFDVHLRGFITTSDCVQAFKEVAPTISEELIGRWFDEVDSDSDGRVTFRDFEMMMKSFLLMPPSSHAH
jgi:Ca2+-binding EF-hand superfamily protein